MVNTVALFLLKQKLIPQVHTHQATIKLAYRANFDSMCLVTDGIGALGLRDGVYTLGQQRIQVTGLQAIVEGTNTLAGAIGTMWFGVKNLLTWSGCSLVHALQAASLHPAQALGIDHRKGISVFEGIPIKRPIGNVTLGLLGGRASK